MKSFDISSPKQMISVLQIKQIEKIGVIKTINSFVKSVPIDYTKKVYKHVNTKADILTSQPLMLLSMKYEECCFCTGILKS